MQRSTSCSAPDVQRFLVRLKLFIALGTHYCGCDMYFRIRLGRNKALLCHWAIICMNAGVTIHAVMGRAPFHSLYVWSCRCCFPAPEFFPFADLYCASFASHCHGFWGCICILTVPFTVSVCEDLLFCVLHRYLSALLSIR